MRRRNSMAGFVKAQLTDCVKTAVIHKGALGKKHRGCSKNATKVLCSWVKI